MRDTLGDPILNKAALLAKKRDFKGAFEILQNAEENYGNSLKYYQLFGVISLYAGSFVEALECLQIAHRLKHKDKTALLGMAAYYLKELNTVKAVDYYLDVLEIDPKDKIAKNALDVIRKYSSSEELSDWIASPERLSKLFPPIPVPLFNQSAVMTGLIALAAAAVIVFSILLITKAIPNPFKTRGERPTSDFVLSAQEKREPIETDGGYYRYILTRDQALRHYENALSLFSAYRDEEAKLSLNRILESNASEGLKNRARLLMDNTSVPGFDTFRRGDNPSFSAVTHEPALYRGVHVIWRGMATNVEVTNEHTRFDFLVGYDTRTTLEGIIPVVFNVPVSINSERPLEVLGKIALDISYSEIRLEGVAIHQSGRLEN